MNLPEAWSTGHLSEVTRWLLDWTADDDAPRERRLEAPSRCSPSFESESFHISLSRKTSLPLTGVRHFGRIASHRGSFHERTYPS
jgi:hypothetical protein